MFESITKFFGGGFNSRTVNQYMKIVDRINKFEHDISKLSDQELKNKTVEFKNLLAHGKTLDDILPEAFAVVREASNRILGLRHFDVQMVGGITLHKGQIAEMKTGEGKTLVATAPVYLNALTGKGVHVVTVNDYLAKRDGEQMGQVYNFLGLSTSVILGGMHDDSKKEAYAADITYGTNHEFGFDYLRDNLKYKIEDMVMRPFNYAVVDEIDSILIDEARTPLIISGQDDNASQMYIALDAVIKTITNADYELDLKTRVINLTEQGVTKVEKKLIDLNIISRPLYDPANVSVVYYVNCALRANKLFKKDVDYMVKNGQILIIDEFTGRTMEGRRYSEGLHQALEAKEGVEIQAESQTIASISYQNLFRLYPKLSGMTGTAMTEEAEFDEIYKLKVVSIPPNKPVIRVDNEDSIYLTMAEKDKAVISLIKDCVKRKQPVLVGTTNLDRSEYISSLLVKEGIKHNVLNAKQHEREAYIISEAGSPGAVTIATNMAGRGTDIKLGGCAETRIMFECADIESEEEKQNKIQEIVQKVQIAHDEVVKAGGLFVIGTERNESRRIDNQLRGRSGRQGDPGASKYFLSLEDELIKRFGSPNLGKTLQKLGVKQNEDLTHKWISKAIAKAQKRVEDYNFDIRKQLLKYDDVMNEQRKMIYEQRLKIIQSTDISEYIDSIIMDTIDNVCNTYASQETIPFEWKLDNLQSEIQHIFNIAIDKNQIANDTNLTFDLFKQQMQDLVSNNFNKIKSICDESALIEYEKELILMTLDNAWKKHLVTLEHVRRSINLQAYAQKNPLNEYKFEAFNIFDTMLIDVKKSVTTNLMHLSPQEHEQHDTEEVADAINEVQQLLAITSTGDISNFISRNAICACGSGKRHKDCCGKLTTLNFQQGNQSADVPSDNLQTSNNTKGQNDQPSSSTPRSSTVTQQTVKTECSKQEDGPKNVKGTSQYDTIASKNNTNKTNDQVTEMQNGDSFVGNRTIDQADLNRRNNHNQNLNNNTITNESQKPTLDGEDSKDIEPLEQQLKVLVSNHLNVQSTPELIPTEEDPYSEAQLELITDNKNEVSNTQNEIENIKNPNEDALLQNNKRKLGRQVSHNQIHKKGKGEINKGQFGIKGTKIKKPEYEEKNNKEEKSKKIKTGKNQINSSMVKNELEKVKEKIDNNPQDILTKLAQDQRRSVLQTDLNTKNKLRKPGKTHSVTKRIVNKPAANAHKLSAAINNQTNKPHKSSSTINNEADKPGINVYFDNSNNGNNSNEPFSASKLHGNEPISVSQMVDNGMGEVISSKQKEKNISTKTKDVPKHKTTKNQLEETNTLKQQKYNNSNTLKVINKENGLNTINKTNEHIRNKKSLKVVRHKVENSNTNSTSEFKGKSVNKTNYNVLNKSNKVKLKNNLLEDEVMQNKKRNIRSNNDETIKTSGVHNGKKNPEKEHDHITNKLNISKKEKTPKSKMTRDLKTKLNDNDNGN